MLTRADSTKRSEPTRSNRPNAMPGDNPAAVGSALVGFFGHGDLSVGGSAQVGALVGLVTTPFEANRQLEAVQRGEKSRTKGLAAFGANVLATAGAGAVGSALTGAATRFIGNERSFPVRGLATAVVVMTGASVAVQTNRVLRKAIEASPLGSATPSAQELPPALGAEAKPNTAL